MTALAESTLVDVLIVGAALAFVWFRFIYCMTRRDVESIQHELERERHLNHYARAVAHYSTPPHEGHEIVPVETGGEVVARLCVTCDKQLAP